MRNQIIAKLQEISKLPADKAKSYDTSMTWAFFAAVT